MFFFCCWRDELTFDRNCRALGKKTSDLCICFCTVVRTDCGASVTQNFPSQIKLFRFCFMFFHTAFLFVRSLLSPLTPSLFLSLYCLRLAKVFIHYINVCVLAGIHKKIKHRTTANKKSVDNKNNKGK